MEPTYSPTRFLIGYWTGDKYVISIVNTETSEQSKPFFATDLRLATAVIESKLQELKDKEKRKNE